MKNLDLSLCLDDLRLETRAAMDRARAMGFHAIDVSAVEGPVSPGELSRTGQRHLIKHLSDLGLRLSSFRGPAGGAGYADSGSGERRLESMRKIMDLASALRVPTVSTTLGGSGGLSPDDRAARYRETLSILADDADRKGVIVTIETAGLTTAELSKLLAEINCPQLAACCDSGEMLMPAKTRTASPMCWPAAWGWCGRAMPCRARRKRPVTKSRRAKEAWTHRASWQPWPKRASKAT
jgi:sugar phosphate isomerase/epimerase